MKALVVGAGSVGQTYAWFLQRAEFEVSFLVRPKRAEELRPGLVLYNLSRKTDRWSPLRMKDFGVLTRFDEVAKERWDYVFLCVPSTSLEDAWFRELAASIGKATFVSLVPGLDERDWILERFPKERLLTGVISLAAYMAPLPGDPAPEPGTAFWFPPLSPCTFSGGEKAESLVMELRLGGFPCSARPDVSKESAVPAAILMAFVLTLEAHGWSFARLRSEGGLETAARAAKEAIEIACRKQGVRPPFFTWLLGPLFYRALLMAAVRVVPFDFEAFLERHFTKVNAQMRQGLERHIELAGELGVGADALKDIREKLPKTTAVA